MTSAFPARRGTARCETLRGTTTSGRPGTFRPTCTGGPRAREDQTGSTRCRVGPLLSSRSTVFSCQMNALSSRSPVPVKRQPVTSGPVGPSSWSFGAVQPAGQNRCMRAASVTVEADLRSAVRTPGLPSPSPSTLWSRFILLTSMQQPALRCVSATCVHRDVLRDGQHGLSAVPAAMETAVVLEHCSAVGHRPCCPRARPARRRVSGKAAGWPLRPPRGVPARRSRRR
jgi:hypothetical protein